MSKEANVLKIVTDAIYKTGMQDRSLDKTLTQVPLEFALDELNKLLDSWRDKIPFDTKIEFNSASDLEQTKFVSISSINYIYGQSISYPLRAVSLSEFSALNNVLNIISIPSIYYFDLLTQNIEIYPRTFNDSGRFIVNGRLSQINLGLEDKIPANMPLFMQDAVVWELAFRIAAEYNLSWSELKIKAYQNAIDRLDSMNYIDIKIDRQPLFGGDNNYGTDFNTIRYLGVI